MGTCTGPSGFVQPVPAAPSCFTPCNRDLVADDGSVVACSRDGLLPGCFAGNVCDRGTCVPPGLEGRSSRGLEAGESCAVDADCGTNAAGDEMICVNGACAALGGQSFGDCESDAECPDFQVCVLGRCFSNCSTDQDCPSPGRCHLHACRLPCVAEGAACPDGYSCDTSDGQSGYCMPTVSPSAVIAAGAPSGRYLVVSDATTLTEVSSFSFTNVRTSARFSIVNETPVLQKFTVRKVQHLEPNPLGGTRVVTEQPLSWLRMGTTGNPRADEAIELEVPAGGSVELELSQAGNPQLNRWDGVVEVSHAALGATPLTLTYRASPSGRWAGTMYFFSTFSTTGLDGWLALSRDAQLLPQNASQVKNAFMQQWIGFKRGDNFTTDRLDAMLQSTQVESYDWPLLRQYCPEPNRRCYPYDNTQGYFEYTSNINEFPIPRGMTELPFAIDVDQDASVPGVAGFSGRVVTAQALHYAGDPAIEVAFTTSPESCGTNASGSVLCQLSRFDVELAVGGRYFPSPEQTDCATPAGRSGYELVRTPWLVPGFLAGTELDTNGLPLRRECRDTTLPFGAEKKEENVQLALSNPIPDGRTRRRTLELVDGALVDAQTMVVIFRETVPSFLGTNDSNFGGLGFMVLRRSPTTLDAASFEGSEQTDTRVQTTDVSAPQCSAELLTAALGAPVAPTRVEDMRTLGRYLLGQAPASNPPATLPVGGEQAHYLCVDTGQFDGGHDNHDGAGVGGPAPCPAGSRVVYFTLTGYNGVLRNHSCNHGYSEAYQTIAGIDGQTTTTRTVLSRGSCEDQLETWVAGETFGVRLDPVWRCTNDPVLGPRSYCDDDAANLLTGKLFYARPSPSQSAVLMPLDTSVDEAFRYKTRFVSRTGRNTAFAPVICGVGTEYCYDPEEIELARSRVDCLLDLYVQNYSLLANASQVDPDYGDLLDDIGDYLRLDFSYRVTTNPATGVTTTKDGFERLYSELMVMLGDEAYTAAFASRFDLAGSVLRSFPGQAFEGQSQGINLSGGAGFEMYTLYLAVQYYDLALERFYKLSPAIWESISLPAGAGVITNESVSAYYSRVIRASTQKAKALGEIARRYQGFNRAELARRVALRAYTSAYLEAMVASNFLSKLRAAAAIQDAPEIDRNLREASMRYRSVLLDMADLYAELSNDSGVQYFGFAPEYVPFPALDPNDINAFEKVLVTLRDKMATAGEKEQVALTSRRDFDTDEVAFQNELQQIRLTYEGQIADACGTFVGEDGQTYPATSKYAYLNETAKTFGDPCGLMGNGTVHEALANVGIAQLELRKAVQAQENILAQIQIEQTRVDELCDAIRFTAEYVEGEQTTIRALDNGIRSAETIKEVAYGVLEVAGTLAGVASCSVTDGECATAAISASAYLGVSIGVAATVVATDIAIQVLEDQKQKIEISTAKWVTERECTYAEIESDAVVKNLWLDLSTAGIEIMQKVEEVKLAASVVVRERNAAQRLIQEQEENEQLAINAAAAKNDPNARIYKNDGIITADRTFRAALREAYRATKIYEYYTSQSYARKEELFLIRLVQYGDISLESYVANLEQAFYEFEEQYGNPDTRVIVVSLRDDVLRIPRLNARTGAALREADRVALFRRALRDPRWLDGRGYVAFDFPLGLELMSPLTRNHKIYYTEAEFVGSDLGDGVGRIYLTSKGTGTVRSVEGEKVFYALPARTSVMNTFFNGNREFFDNTRVSDIYANFRLRDLPVANSNWQVVINTKDELVNQDVNLESLSDIKLHLYYRDFTEL